jgi:hypothetical protein
MNGERPSHSSRSICPLACSFFPSSFFLSSVDHRAIRRRLRHPDEHGDRPGDWVDLIANAAVD